MENSLTVGERGFNVDSVQLTTPWSLTKRMGLLSVEAQ